MPKAKPCRDCGDKKEHMYCNGELYYGGKWYVLSNVKGSEKRWEAEVKLRQEWIDANT